LDALRVLVRRGDVVEAVHRVHVRGEWSYGDDIVCFLRSSAKPIQAVPLAEAYDDLDDDELAIACASHQAEPAQLDAVRRLLARAGATVDDLENGEQEGRPEGKLGHNCSGKHAGMLAACRANGWPTRGYRLPGHPLQQRIHELVGGVEYETDGCGVPTFALALSEMVRVFARTPQRVRDAMRARPELVGGRGADDTALMSAAGGWFAKRGAEGLFCAADDGGRAFALKVEDGATRAVRPALAHLLPGCVEVEPIVNSRGEIVGGYDVESPA
jgi:L-asparaginase II